MSATSRQRPLDELPLILVDQQEKMSLPFSLAVRMQPTHLETGDYTVAGATDLVRIERKAKGDFVSCCTGERERFLDQMDRLAAYPIRALVIEATWDELATGLYVSRATPKSITGTLLAQITDRAIPVLLVGDARGAAEVIERMLTRVWLKRRAAVKEASRP